MLLTQRGGQREWSSPLGRAFPHRSHCFWHLPWTWILPVAYPLCRSSQMLTTFLFILTNEQERKQHSEHILHFWTTQEVLQINISSAAQWSTTFQPSNSKIRHYSEHFAKLFSIKRTVHLKNSFSSFIYQAQQRKIYFFSRSPPIPKYFSPSLLYVKCKCDET